ncbi:hypothetical protein JCGZ_22105 [Jatropha curcas]|uniref:Uncharacterized protein n=1 Tax=Jatropha curcas TaxID=180498 RepID=A0A067K250_JATCU|nr:hypothetical protein JCGZ_22105 [Jatropha curcas]
MRGKMRCATQEDFRGTPLGWRQWMNEYNTSVDSILKCSTFRGCPSDGEWRNKIYHTGRLQGCSTRMTSTDE